MGLSIDDLRFLVAAETWGVRYDRVLTIGRQNVYASALNLERLIAEHRPGVPPGLVAQALRDPYLDTFLKILGAQRLDVLDVSSFEGASLIHDLNQPLPDSLKASHDTVIEVGSLEHVFDARQAIANLMELVSADGHLVIVSPTNNWCGHGFYQFSPEFFFRALSEVNGFRIVRMIVHEDFAGSPWYDVADPAAINKRVTLVNPLPASLAIVAQRVRVQPVLHSAPQQSDYLMLWQKKPAPQDRPLPTAANRMIERVRRFAWRCAPGLGLAVRRRRYLSRRNAEDVNSTRNRRFYTPVKPGDA